mgnify:CR=1 FL=1
MQDKITKDMIMVEIITNWPKAATILIEDYDLHCVSCSMAAYENLEQGLASHGYDDKKIDQIIKKLNQAIAKK